LQEKSQAIILKT